MVIIDDYHVVDNWHWAWRVTNDIIYCPTGGMRSGPGIHWQWSSETTRISSGIYCQPSVMFNLRLDCVVLDNIE